MIRADDRVAELEGLCHLSNSIPSLDGSTMSGNRLTKGEGASPLELDMIGSRRTIGGGCVSPTAVR